MTLDDLDFSCAAESPGSSAGDREAAIAAAREQGFAVIETDEHSLLCDLDTPAAQEQFHRVLPVIRRYWNIERTEYWPSKSGNLHARVCVREALTFVERTALEAALGSDGVRAVLGLVRDREGVQNPTVLFKPAGVKVA